MAEKPKRPLSGYMIWLNENRAKIKKENPDFKVTEIAKKAGEMWRALGDKTEWENKAAKAKEDYMKACKDFESNGGVATSKKRGKKEPKKAAKKSKNADDDDEDESE